LRIRVKALGIQDLALQGKFLKIAPYQLAESAQMKVARLYPGSIVKSATNTVMVARPTMARWAETDATDGQGIGDTALLDWVTEVIDLVTSGGKK
jgi:transcription-repair coupling factor (superfamily II helicase)